MSDGIQYPYDAFISYSSKDAAWVRGELLPRLEQAGVKVIIDFRDFEIGTPSLINMERAVDRSRHTLVVLTPNWIASEWTEFESLLVGTRDPAGRRRKLIPLMIQKCDLPPRIAMLTYLDLTDRSSIDEYMPRLIKSLIQPTHHTDTSTSKHQNTEPRPRLPSLQSLNTAPRVVIVVCVTSVAVMLWILGKWSFGDIFTASSSSSPSTRNRAQSTTTIATITPNYFPNGPSAAIESFVPEIIDYDGTRDGGKEKGTVQYSVHSDTSQDPPTTSYKLTYDMPQQGAGYGGIIFDFNGARDVSVYKALQFVISFSDVDARCTLQLRDIERNQVEVILDNESFGETIINGQQTVTIPFDQHPSIDFSKLWQVLFVVNSNFVRGEHTFTVSNLQFIKN